MKSRPVVILGFIWPLVIGVLQGLVLPDVINFGSPIASLLFGVAPLLGVPIVATFIYRELPSRWNKFIRILAMIAATIGVWIIQSALAGVLSAIALTIRIQLS